MKLLIALFFMEKTTYHFWIHQNWRWKRYPKGDHNRKPHM